MVAIRLCMVMAIGVLEAEFVVFWFNRTSLQENDIHSLAVADD